MEKHDLFESLFRIHGWGDPMNDGFLKQEFFVHDRHWNVNLNVIISINRNVDILEIIYYFFIFSLLTKYTDLMKIFEDVLKYFYRDK